MRCMNFRFLARAGVEGKEKRVPRIVASAKRESGTWGWLVRSLVQSRLSST